MTRTLTIVALAAALAATGCLQKETTSTIYLRTDGSFDWVVLERHVRSDESDAAKREAEEFGYVDGVARDRHPVAEAFRALGGQDVRTRLLRDTTPVRRRWSTPASTASAAVFDSQLAGCGVATTSRRPSRARSRPGACGPTSASDGEKLADSEALRLARSAACSTPST